jgi:hypothetical protein
MVIRPYDGLSLPNSVEIDEIAVWVQIHNLPDEYRGKNLSKNLVKKRFEKVGELETKI